MILHPRERDLQLFAQNNLAISARTRRHLQQCCRCQSVVRDYHSIADAASHPSGVTAPREVIDRVLALRATGHRAILPFADPNPGRRRHAIATVAALALIGVVTMLLRAPNAGAGVSDLTFMPAKPRPGAVVEVMYRPTALLVGHPKLLLRARLRTEHDEQYNSRTHQIVVSELEPQRDGTFRGRLTLPVGSVYAAFAVESEDGELIDSNHRRLWELLVHGDNGLPIPNALIQKSNDMMGRDWVRAHAAVDSVTHIEPRNPRHWQLLLFFQKQIVRGAALDALLPSHRARLRSLDREYEDREQLDADQLRTLMWYAVSMNDSLVANKWRKRLLSEAPLNTYALQERIIPFLNRHDDKPDMVLPFLEQLWSDTRGQPEIGPGFSHLYQQGFGAALRSRDTAAIAKWSERYLTWSPREKAWVAAQLAYHPHFRARAIKMLMNEADKFQNDDRFRDLHRTRSDEKRLGRRERQQLFATLAKALLANGDTVAAIRNYDLAARLYWNPELFRNFAELKLASGDTTRAMELLADATADPATPDAFSDTAQTMLNLDGQAWTLLQRRASERMRVNVMESAIRVLLPRDLRLDYVNGGRTTLAALTNGKPAVVVFWSRNCGFALLAAPRIQLLAEQLRKKGTPLIVVADEKPSSELAHAMESAGLRAPLYADASGEIAAGFNVFGTPSYFVLDGNGNVRFEYSSLADIPRQVVALKQAR